MLSAGGMGLAGSILSQEVDGASVFCALCHLLFACAKEGESFGVVMARGLIVGLPGTCCWLGHYWCACIPSGLAAHAALYLPAHAALYCGFVTSVRGRPQASETMLLAGARFGERLVELPYRVRCPEAHPLVPDTVTLRDDRSRSPKAVV